MSMMLGSKCAKNILSAILVLSHSFVGLVKSLSVIKLLDVYDYLCMPRNVLQSFWCLQPAFYVTEAYSQLHE